MRTLLRPSLLVLGTFVVLAAGSGVVALAGWISHTDSRPFTIRAAAIPPVPAPTVTLVRVAAPGIAPAAGPQPDADGSIEVPRISWPAVRITDDEAVHSYVVTRHAGSTSRVVCTRPAWRTRSCLDRTAPPGATLTYTVTATHGAHWVGPDSAPSVAVTMPGTPVTATASSTPATPGPTGPASTPPASTPPAVVGPADGVPLQAPSQHPAATGAPPASGSAVAPAPSTRTSAEQTGSSPTGSGPTPTPPAG